MNRVENRSLRKIEIDLQRDNSILSKQVADYERQIIALKKEITDLKDRNSILNDNLNYACERLESKVNEGSKFLTQIAELKNTVSELTAALSPNTETEFELKRKQLNKEVKAVIEKNTTPFIKLETMAVPV